VGVEFQLMKALIAICLFAIVALIVYLRYCRWNRRALFIKPIFELEEEHRRGKCIALTFDDGPDPAMTPDVLNLLEKYGVRSTFFMIGRKVEKFSWIAHRVHEMGHSIGNHSYTHKKLIFRSVPALKWEIEETDLALRRAGIPVSNLFRPPFGLKLVLLPLVIRLQGKKLITWSLNPKEQYNKNDLDKDRLVHQVLNEVRPGAIILMHDCRHPQREDFLQALDAILAGLLSNGYRFVTLK
jgi:peptidoglycan/xylan/chitin deacetylase (PgdA/CDA1 family)